MGKKRWQVTCAYVNVDGSLRYETSDRLTRKGAGKVIRRCQNAESAIEATVFGRFRKDHIHAYRGQREEGYRGVYGQDAEVAAFFDQELGVNDDFNDPAAHGWLGGARVEDANGTLGHGTIPITGGSFAAPRGGGDGSVAVNPIYRGSVVGGFARVESGGGARGSRDAHGSDDAGSGSSGGSEPEGEPGDQSPGQSLESRRGRFFASIIPAGFSGIIAIERGWPVALSIRERGVYPQDGAESGGGADGPAGATGLQQY